MINLSKRPSFIAYLFSGFFVFIVLFHGPLCGDGIIMPQPPPGIVTPPKFYLQVVTHNVSAQIQDNVAQVEIEEEFKNPYKFTVQGDFLFPLPEGASVSKFSLFVGGKEIKGEVLPSDEARRIYEEMVRRRKDPALLEYYNQSLFRAKVFPIPPGETRKVLLRYEEVLNRVGPAYRWRYPLKIEGLSASPIEKVLLKVNLKTKRPIRAAYSPTHALELVSRGPKELVGVWEDQNVTPKTDFLFYFVPTRDSIATIFLPYRKGDKRGHFLLTLSPGYWREEREIPKDVVFALDISGSMKGKKIEDAMKALSYFLTALNPDDRFAIVTFSGDVNVFSDDWVKVTEESRQRAKDFVEALIAEGGTNFYGALRRALSYRVKPKRPTFLVMLTDGAPTVGPTDPDTILERTENLLKGQKIFVFGVGANVNTFLLDRLARLGHGSPEYVRTEENLEDILSSFYNRIAFPAVTDLKISFEGIDVEDLYPQEYSALFYGEDLVIAGRYVGDGKGIVRVSGFHGRKKISYRKELDFPVRDERFAFVGRIWAMRRVADLLDRIRIKGEKEEWVEEIKKLGKKYGIVTPYTSYLVREAKEVPYMAQERSVLKAETGVEAFGVARSLSGMRSTSRVFLPEEGKLPVKYLAGKTFFLKDSVWTDTEYKENMSVIEISFGSEGYFRFLNKYPELAPFVSLGENVIFVYKDKAYRVKKGT